MGGPDWLRSFGIDAVDINCGGYQDIVCGKYFYLNPGEYMEGKWKAPRLDIFINETGN